MSAVIHIHVHEFQPKATYWPRDDQGSDGFVTLQADEQTHLFIGDKTHAQVWLNDALRQVNDIEEPNDDFQPCPVTQGSGI